MMKPSTCRVQSGLSKSLRRLGRLVEFGSLVAILVATNSSRAEETDNGLLRLETGRPIFSNLPYERLCQEKLFVTSGEVARYFFVPAFRHPETLVSVHRSGQSAGSLAGNYWVTVTRPTRRLGQVFTDPKARVSDAKAIKVERRDAPIPEATAQALHRVWLAMLQAARPRTRLDMLLDSDTMFFSVTDAMGKTLRAQYYGPGDDGFALAQIGDSLIGYGYAPVRQRPALARQIEAKASALYNRVR